MSEQHTLHIDTRKNSWNVDGRCSCLKWRMINHTRADVREGHAAHLQDMLGPEAQERRLEGK